MATQAGQADQRGKAATIIIVSSSEPQPKLAHCSLTKLRSRAALDRSKTRKPVGIDLPEPHQFRSPLATSVFDAQWTKKSERINLLSTNKRYDRR